MNSAATTPSAEVNFVPSHEVHVGPPLSAPLGGKRVQVELHEVRAGVSTVVKRYYVSPENEAGFVGDLSALHDSAPVVRVDQPRGVSRAAHLLLDERGALPPRAEAPAGTCGEPFRVCVEKDASGAVRVKDLHGLADVILAPGDKVEICEVRFRRTPGGSFRAADRFLDDGEVDDLAGLMRRVPVVYARSSDGTVYLRGPGRDAATAVIGLFSQPCEAITGWKAELDQHGLLVLREQADPAKVAASKEAWAGALGIDPGELEKK